MYVTSNSANTSISGYVWTANDIARNKASDNGADIFQSSPHKSSINETSSRLAGPPLASATFESPSNSSSNANGDAHDVNLTGGTESKEAFDWDEYLQSSTSVAAPHPCFKHVDVSLFNGFSPGMKLEVANKQNKQTYWVATLISTCGTLLLLRYDGSGDDRKYDFWADISSADLHPIGWCAQTGKTLQPPEHIKDKHEHWVAFLMKNLVGARSAPARLLDGPHRGKTVIELIDCRMILEVQDSQHPQHVWVVEVIGNVGGRLLLRYKGLQKNDCEYDFWLFFLDPRLHHFGWGKSSGLTMRPPDAICHRHSTKEKWARVLTLSLLGFDESMLVPECVFKDQVKFKRHSVKESWKLAILDPVNHDQVRLATVVRVIDEFFFLAEFDGMTKNNMNCAMLCHSGSSGIFSLNWCKEHKVPVEPNDQYGGIFDWDVLFQETTSVIAPSTCFPHCNEKHSFEVGMKLEACNPFNLHDICVASVLNVYGGILHLELYSSSSKPIRCYYQASSMDIFPAGWCQSNNYPLSAPQHVITERDEDFNVLPKNEMRDNGADLSDDVQAIRRVINPSSGSKLWCPVLCFNCICKTGPFLNDCDLSRVPKFVGPGNTILVLKEVMTLLVKAAERPHKLLKDLEDFTENNWDHPCIIKTKFGGKKYQGTLHIVDAAKDVDVFIKTLMRFLRCCPCLITIGQPVNYCPHNCVTTRGRPPLKKYAPRKNMEKKLGHKLLSSDTDHSKKHTLSPILPAGAERKIQRGVDNIAPWNCPSPSTIQKVYEDLETKRQISRIRKLHLHSNPLHWNTNKVVEFIQSTDCARWAACFSQNRVDGQALLLLTMPDIQHHFGMKLGEALKVARQVERVKIAFYEQFCS